MFYRRTDSITFNGYNSYLDFGVTIKSKNIALPEQVIIEQEVPYMDGCYDFSCMSGKPIYKKRQISVIFNIIGIDENDLYDKYTQLVQWLTSQRNAVLMFDSIRGWQFENATARIPSGGFVQLSRIAAELTVTFVTDPYKTNGKQNVTLIPACPAFKGNTFGYIQKSGGELKMTTTDSICADIQFSASTVGGVVLQEYTVTEDTPAEFAVTAYLSPNAAGQMQIADTDGNTAEIAPEAVSEYGGGKLAVYRYSSEKYPNAGAIRFTADVTDFRSISAMTFDETITAHSAPVRCRRNDTDISFRINNSGEITETTLSEGGNIIMIPGTAPAEVYAACRKEVL